MAALASLVLAGGCSIKADYNGTSFLCTDQPVCPAGYSCQDGVCVTGQGGGGGGGVDAGGGGVGGAPDAGNPLTGFAFRQQLTFNNGERGALQQFPVMVMLNPDRFDYSAVRSDGGDLQFADTDGTPLPHEIETWNPAGTSILWVRVPLIDAGSTTDSIWLYYGKPDATVAQDPAAVWSSYRAVYHLDAAGADVSAVLDSTGQHFDGTSLGSDALSGGVLAGSRRFDGDTDYIDLGQGRDFLRATSAFTVEEWVRPGTLVNSGVVFGSSINGDVVSRSQLEIDTGLAVNGGARTQDGGSLLTTTGGTVTSGTWTWVVFEADFPHDTLSLYYNADLSTEQSGLGFDALTPDTSDQQTVLGVDEDVTSNHFLGALDEVRVSTSKESPDWLTAQYATMRDRLISYGSPESL